MGAVVVTDAAHVLALCACCLALGACLASLVGVARRGPR